MEQTSIDLIELAKAELAAEEVTQLESLLAAPDPEGLPAEIVQEAEVKEEAAEEKMTDVRALLSKMSMAERIKAAMFGNATVRKILVLDPSRMIQECVLGNPKLGLNEVEDFSKNPNMCGQVLRSISGKATWMRSYKLKSNLVCNPKCPPDLSLKWLKFLNDCDVKNLSRSKNVPQVLQLAAKKMVAEKDKR
jgi:hypothetical protein